MVVEGDWEETGRGNCSQDVISERKKNEIIGSKNRKEKQESPICVLKQRGWLVESMHGTPRPCLLCGLLSSSSVKTVMVAADPSTSMASFSEPGPNLRLPSQILVHKKQTAPCRLRPQCFPSRGASCL